MDLSRKVAFNTFIQIVSKTTTVIFGLLTTILLTGYLGREGYGEYMFIITLVILFGAFADWGTATIGVREAAKKKKGQDHILSNILLVRLLIAFGGALLMTIFSFFVPFQTQHSIALRPGIILGSLILLLFATKASFGIMFQTKLQMQNLALADITGSFSTLALSWFFIHQNFGLLPLIGAIILANIVALLVAWLLASRMIKFDFQVDRVFIQKLISESLPMGAILLVFTVDNKIDTIMLGTMKGSAEVGVYAIAYRVYDVLILGAAYLMNALLPVISRYSVIRNKRLRSVYQKAFDVLLMMGIGVFLMVLFLAPLMVKVLTQDRIGEFNNSILVLRLLSVALFFSYFNHLTGYTIVALGKQRPYFLIALGALAFNLFANLALIPMWSYYGAAMVTIFTEVVVLVATNFFIYRLLNFVPSLSSFPKTMVQIIKQRGRIF